MKLLILGCSFSHGIPPYKFKENTSNAYGWTYQLFKKYNIDIDVYSFPGGGIREYEYTINYLEYTKNKSIIKIYDKILIQLTNIPRSPFIISDGDFEVVFKEKNSNSTFKRILLNNCYNFGEHGYWSNIGITKGAADTKIEPLLLSYPKSKTDKFLFPKPFLLDHAIIHDNDIKVNDQTKYILKCKQYSMLMDYKKELISFNNLIKLKETNFNNFLIVPYKPLGDIILDYNPLLFKKQIKQFKNKEFDPEYSSKYIAFQDPNFYSNKGHLNNKGQKYVLQWLEEVWELENFLNK